MTHWSDTEDPRRRRSGSGPTLPHPLLSQGAHLTHIPKLLDRRQEGGERSKGNRGHWKVKWGHKGSWGVGCGVDKYSRVDMPVNSHH